MPQLPSLEETLLCSILKKLPEETAQIQFSLAQVATKYRTDLDAQLASTLQFQKVVARSHERLQKRLKASVRYVDEVSKSLKVGVDESLSNEVEELSEQVMGKLMGIMELIGTTNVDGERWPMLKRALGQEGYEVVDSMDEQSTVTDLHGLMLDPYDETSDREECDENINDCRENPDSALGDVRQQERFDGSQSELADDEQEDDDQQENSLLVHQNKDRNNCHEENREAHMHQGDASEDLKDRKELTQEYNRDCGILQGQRKLPEEQESQNLRSEDNREDELTQAYSAKFSGNEDRENQKDEEELIVCQKNSLEEEENEGRILSDDSGIGEADPVSHSESAMSDSRSLQHNGLPEATTVTRDSLMQSCDQYSELENLPSSTLQPEDSKESTPSLEDHLHSIETTINKYKTRKLRPIPLPKTSSTIGSLQSQDSTSVHGLVIRSGSLSLDESLRRFK